MADSPRVLKKYPNRRLYDPAESRYVTLEDVRRLVLEHKPFTVADSRTGRDLTRSILLQIIAEEEELQNSPLFSVEFLERLIRFYGDTVQASMAVYLEQSLALFLDQQREARERFSQSLSAFPPNPIDLVASLAKQNATLWEQWGRSLLHPQGERGKKE